MADRAHMHTNGKRMAISGRAANPELSGTCPPVPIAASEVDTIRAGARPNMGTCGQGTMTLLGQEIGSKQVTRFLRELDMRMWHHAIEIAGA
jgi:hypothetical protein